MLGKIEGGEGGDRGWDGCMTPPTQWTWVWANARTWQSIGRPGVLQCTGSQRVRPDWVIERQAYGVSLGYVILLEVVPCPSPSRFTSGPWLILIKWKAFPQYLRVFVFKIVHYRAPGVRKLQVCLWLSHGLMTVTLESQLEVALFLHESFPLQCGQESPGNVVSSLLNIK